MTALKRTLGVGDAVVIGAGSMIGAGAFAAWAPAAEAAGSALLVGLAIAGIVAFCNATSSAQLAALHPESGGTYVYARIATLGEDAREPEVTIPKAVPRALGAVLVLYAIVGVTALAVVGSDALSATDAPLRPVVAAGADALSPVVRIGAGIASLGVLLNLIPGVSRTSLAMARRRELPSAFAHVDTARALPIRAELTVATIVVVLVLVLQLRSAIAVSGVAVLTYYALTNAAALRLSAERRRWTPALAWIGLVGCIVLIASLPVEALIGGGILLVFGSLAGGRPQPEVSER